MWSGVTWPATSPYGTTHAARARIWALTATFEARIARWLPVGQFDRRGLHVAVDHEVDEAEAVRVLGRDRLAGHQVVLRPVGSREQRPDELGSVAGAGPDQRVGVGERRATVGVDDVAEEGQGHPEPAGRPVDGRDHRLVQRQKVVHHLPADLVGRRRRGGVHRLVQVAARGEGTPGAREHQDVDVRVEVDVVRQTRELVVQPVVDRVQPLGAVQPRHQDAVVPRVEFDVPVPRRVDHRAPPQSPGRQITGNRGWSSG